MLVLARGDNESLVFTASNGEQVRVILQRRNTKVMVCMIEGSQGIRVTREELMRSEDYGRDLQPRVDG